MKNTLINAAVVLVAISTAASRAQTPNVPMSGSTAGTHYEWGFGSSASPAAPDAATGGAGNALAIIAPDPVFASGWMANCPILAGAQGIWDLGREGTITLSNPEGLAGSPVEARVVAVSVAQYQDGGIYDQLAQVSVPGATLVDSSTSSGAAGTVGGWTVAKTQWRADAGVAVNSIQITSPYYGALIDQVMVESSLASAPAGPQLSIRSIGNGQVEISWPSAAGTVVLESTADVKSANGWSSVNAAVQTNGSTSSVTLDATGDAQFYRLRKP